MAISSEILREERHQLYGELTFVLCIFCFLHPSIQSLFSFDQVYRDFKTRQHKNHPIFPRQPTGSPLLTHLFHTDDHPKQETLLFKSLPVGAEKEKKIRFEYKKVSSILVCNVFGSNNPPTNKSFIVAHCFEDGEAIQTPITQDATYRAKIQRSNPLIHSSKLF